MLSFYPSFTQVMLTLCQRLNNGFMLEGLKICSVNMHSKDTDVQRSLKPTVALEKNQLPLNPTQLCSLLKTSKCSMRNCLCFQMWNICQVPGNRSYHLTTRSRGNHWALGQSDNRTRAFNYLSTVLGFCHSNKQLHHWLGLRDQRRDHMNDCCKLGVWLDACDGEK